MSIRGRIRSTTPLGLLASGVLGTSAALLVSCGGSSKLIPVANSEPLQKDFEEVARAAEGAHGSCTGTEVALRKAEQDYAALPASLDAGLRRRLHEGIDKLRADALELCVQPATSTQATTNTQPTTTSTAPPTTQPTTPQTTTTQTIPTTTGPGGTPAPKEGEGEGEGEEPASGKHDHKGGDGGRGASGGAAPGGEGGK
jgi:hypothetical protein